jgi:hypothetical protein
MKEVFLVSVFDRLKKCAEFRVFDLNYSTSESGASFLSISGYGLYYKWNVDYPEDKKIEYPTMMLIIGELKWFAWNMDKHVLSCTYDYCDTYTAWFDPDHKRHSNHEFVAVLDAFLAVDWNSL